MGLLETGIKPAPVLIKSSAEGMVEVRSASVRLMIGASVHLGKGVGWDSYQNLYQSVYIDTGLRVTRADGLLIIIQTNAYEDGQFICRYNHLTNMMRGSGWDLIDERVWIRRKADHFQVPFSHVLIYRPTGGTMTRQQLNKSGTDWFRGVWDYPQTKGGAINGYPDGLCDLLIKSCTLRGDLILDPFAGTGRLLGRAVKAGRRAFGYEIDQALVNPLIANYCEPLIPRRTMG